MKGGEKMLKNKIISLAAIAILGIATIGTTTVFAQNTANNKHISFVTELAQKLGIDQAKVQKAVSEVRADQKSQQQARYKAMLDQAVKNGKLTATQEQAILDERTQLKTLLTSDKKKFQAMSVQQRRDAHKAIWQNVRSWAEKNGISLKYLKKLGGRLS